jgi:carbamate kinase
MMPDVLVIAFGGNAIHPSGQRGTLEEQRENVRRMSVELGRLVLAGHRVVATHGNGPQVGEIMLRSDLTRETVPPVTMDVAGAMTQGQIGYLLQQEIGNYLTQAGAKAEVCSLVTQVEVDAADPAFGAPTKPIGRFYGKDEAERLERESGWHMVEDAGRGYRRVVPSPMPRTIVEWPAIRALLDVGQIVIAAGGGGVPVVRTPQGGYDGVEAVIDKDRSAQKLATLVGANVLVLLTEVEAVAVHFGTPDQRPLHDVSLDEIRSHYAEGEFPKGSMGPKIEAAIAFLEAGGERVIITSAANLGSAEDGKAGTRISVSAPVESGR